MGTGMPGGGRGLLIGKRIQHTVIPGPLAHPLQFKMDNQDGPVIAAFGGLTKVEYMAGQALPVVLRSYGIPALPDECDHVSKLACNLAESLLAECARRQQMTQQTSE